MSCTLVIYQIECALETDPPCEDRQIGFNLFETKWRMGYAGKYCNSNQVARLFELKIASLVFSPEFEI